MTKVLQFPADKQLASRLHEMKEKMDEIYDALNRAYELTNAIEEKATILEADYNETLDRYSQAVGVGNVEVGFLEYATKNVTIGLEGNDVVFKWEPDSEDSEV